MGLTGRISTEMSISSNQGDVSLAYRARGWVTARPDNMSYSTFIYRYCAAKSWSNRIQLLSAWYGRPSFPCLGCCRTLITGSPGHRVTPQVLSGHQGPKQGCWARNDKIEVPVDMLRAVDKEVRDRNNGPGEADILRTIYTSVESCEDIIVELRSEWEKFDINRPDTRALDRVRVIGHREIYPLRQSTLQKLDEDITEIIQHLSLQ